MAYAGVLVSQRLIESFQGLLPQREHPSGAPSPGHSLSFILRLEASGLRQDQLAADLVGTRSF